MQLVTGVFSLIDTIAPIPKLINCDWSDDIAVVFAEVSVSTCS